MAKKKESIQSLMELYVHELKDTYNAEQQIVKALPKIIEAVSSEELQTALQHHLEETQEQVSRLEQIFENLEQKPGKVVCEGMKGIIKEGDSILEMEAPDEVLDAALIAAAQKVEHYEIATYGTLCTYAAMLGQKENHELLSQSLAEEKEADQKLTEIAESGVNEQAEGQESEETQGAGESEESEEEYHHTHKEKS